MDNVFRRRNGQPTANSDRRFRKREEYRSECYKFHLEVDTSNRFAHHLKNFNYVSLKVTIRIMSAYGTDLIRRITMPPQSRQQLRDFSKDCKLKILDAVPAEMPFIVGKLADAPLSAEMCTFSIGEDAIFVNNNILRGLDDFKWWLLLDETQHCVIEDVEFPIFVTFFKLIFNCVTFCKSRNLFKTEDCRKLVDLFQRFCSNQHNSLFCDVQKFLRMDFYSATNIYCVFHTPDQEDDTMQFNKSLNLWNSPFLMKHIVIKKQNHMQLFQHFQLNWKFYTCIEKINNVEYLGIGVIVEPAEILERPYFEQPVEISITIKNCDSSFSKQITFSQDFNHYQSSVGCPVIARMDEIPWEKRNHLMIEAQVGNITKHFSEFCGEKDITLVVEGKKIITSKNLLIHHFDYFKTLFESNFEDKNQKELVLHDVKYEDMYNIMDVIYNRSKSLTVNELEAMLILADRFFCSYIINYVDIAITGLLNGATSSIPLEEKKYFAETYNPLVRVKEDVKREPQPFFSPLGIFAAGNSN